MDSYTYIVLPAFVHKQTQKHQQRDDNTRVCAYCTLVFSNYFHKDEKLPEACYIFVFK